MFRKVQKTILERLFYPSILIALIIWILSNNFKWWEFSKDKQQVVATMISNPIFETLTQDQLSDYNYDLPIEEQEQYLKYTFTTNERITIVDSIFYYDYRNPDNYLTQSEIGFYQAIKKGETFYVWYSPKDPTYYVADWLYNEYDDKNFSDFKRSGFIALILALIAVILVWKFFISKPEKKTTT